MNRLRELAVKANSDDAVVSDLLAYGKWVNDNAEHIADLIDAAQEIIGISDRKHDAWDKAKAALAKLEAK